MIRGLIIFSLIIFSVISCTNTSDTNFTVEGKLENLSVSEIYAVKELTKDSISIDTITVDKGGKFTYKGKVESQALVSLFMGEGLKPLRFFLEPDYKVSITGDALEGDLVEIRGGRVNNDLAEFKKKNANILQSRYRVLAKNENLDVSELKNINYQLARCVRECVESDPAKISAVILMNDFSINNISLDLLGNDIELLKGEAANFYLTTSLKEYYDRVKISMVGSVAPDFTLQSTRGKSVSLKDFKGKPVLLIFDLKDAPANEAYFTLMKETQAKLKDKVQFVAIVIDEDDKSPDPKIIEIANSLDWTVLLDGRKWNSQTVKKYNVTEVPYMILISKDGIIEDRDVSFEALLELYKNK
ncbi:AhpC/TSA family protein [Dysgonomonas alginatilytica]|uniref:AhpC/TSA family protein n=2 Tax=Dysgonomonas alginatilytica TaxID=1605892 RepID=A0A2V3PU65_9BACT|nr:AhpC/TSA family protein [Dysgonomonas alginatilytica]